MEREAAFAAAAMLISALPRTESTIDFWDTPLINSAIGREAWTDTTDRIEKIARAVGTDIADYFFTWASDAAVGVGDLVRGYELLPVPTVGARRSMRADNRLDLKLALGLPVDARDITSLFGPRVTTFGKQNIGAIELHLQIQIDLLAATRIPININAWMEDAHRHPAGYTLFSGHPSYLATRPPSGWHFSLSPTAEAFCVRMIREAENTWREECDLPRVGEGWLAETQLFYMLKDAFPHLDVIQHYRAEWLGRQHLDVGLPQLRVGIEYQGAQHDQPIAFFGGDEAFARTVERDRRKASRCRREGWRLIYVREGYDQSSLLADIRGAKSRR